ncbi:MAG: hypothetical protein Tsb0034_23600 [Ekhidna sp.]
MVKYITIATVLLLPFASNSSITRVDQLHSKCYELFDVSYDSVLFVANEALKLSEKSGYSWGIANSYYIKAYVYDEQGDFSKALLMYLNASSNIGELEDERSLKTSMDIALNIGSILRKHYKYNEAIDFYDDALSKADVNHFPSKRLKLLYNKASVLQDKKDLPYAIETLNEAVQVSKMIEDDRMMLKCWNLLGLVFKDNGDYSSAKYHYQKIIASPEAVKKAIALAFHNIGIVANNEKKYDSAIIAFSKAEALEKEIDHKEFLFMTLLETSKTYLKKNKPDKALHYSEECEKLYGHVTRFPETFGVFHLLDSLNHLEGDFDASRKYSDQFHKESIAFFGRQKEIIKLKDQFQIDLLIAGFYKEQEVKRRNSIFQRTIVVLLLIGFVTSLFFYLRHWIWRNDLRKSVAPYIK